MDGKFGMYIQARQFAIVNKLLTGVIVGLGLYIALAPLIPGVWFWLRHSSVSMYWTNLFVRDTESVAFVITPRARMESPVATVEIDIPNENTISIPHIGVYAPIVEGVNVQAMEEGVWHRPGTGDPVAGGNMVLVGHRFLYISGPRTLYNLDKVKAGDVFSLYWQGKQYTYVVESTLITLPNAIEIEQQTEAPLLTIYTCTPLFTVDKRLVVRARPL